MSMIHCKNGARLIQSSMRGNLVKQICVMNYSSGGDALGRGSGKGGGGGGSIRAAGGAFGELEAAREEEYFHKLQRSQLKNLRQQLDSEVGFHEQHLKHHQEAIERHRKRMEELAREEKELERESKK